MNFIKHTLLILLFPLVGICQVKKLSLEDCISLAKENNIQVQNQNYTISKLENDVEVAKGVFLPDLNLNASQSYNLGDSFNVSTSLGQRESSASIFSLSSSVVLFEGKATVNKLKYSKLNVERNEIELEKIKRELELLVTNDYLQALLFKEAIATAENQLQLSEQQLERIKVLYESGIVTKKELLENESLLETDRKNKVVASINYKNSLLSISERISLEKIEPIVIQELDIKSVKDHFLWGNQTNYTKDLERHPIVLASDSDIELQALKLKIDKSAYYPSLYFNYEYGSGYYHLLGEDDLVFNAITNEFEDNGFLKQLDSNKSHNLVFSLTVPIFNRLATRSTIRNSKNDYEISKINLIENKKLLYNKVELAYNEMLSTKATYESNKKTLKFQEEVFRVSTEQYEAGIINIYNFIDSKNRFLNTQSEFIKSKYEYLLKIKILEFYTV